MIDHIKCSLFCLLLVIFSVNCYDRPLGLYNNDDSVVILDDTNFHSTISNRSNAWMVEFYASWCGYCQGFAPVFKRFSKEVARWTDVIKVAVIDCGDRINFETVCKGANLTGFPTIKFYLPFSDKDDTGFNRVSEDHSAEGLLIDTINFVEQMIEEMVELKPNISHLWPHLQPLSKLSDVEILPDNTEDTAVIIEHQNSFIGRQIILDLWRRNNSYPVVRRLIETGGNIAEKLNISTLPIVAVFNSQNQTVYILKSESNEKSSLEQSIIDFMRIPNISSLSPTEFTEKSSPEEFLLEEDDIIRRRYTLYLNDLDKTVIFAINQEILLKQNLNELEENSLRDFIDILIKFYPSESAIYDKISQVQNWLELKDQDKLDMQQISEIMEPVRNIAPRWIGCRGSEEKFGGYSCGLWSLWHYLTVAQLEVGEGESDEVLRAMISYVRNFFGCRECSSHFLQMVKNGTVIDSQVDNYEEAVLFLWRKHNEVNLRLSGDASDDPLYPKGYFPPKKFCPDCYSGDTEKEGAIQRENI